MSGAGAVSIGVVAIGRNEGERLRRCLESLRHVEAVKVYVDSGSTDGSVELARAMGVEVVELDTSIPFSAARARNAGFERLMAVGAGLAYVQFVDGDCEFAGEWIGKAVAALEGESELAVVCGRRREREPGASIYNRICDLEWDTPVGEAQACGGDSMMRVAALTQAGGFNAGVVAGEEPELCSRMRLKGWRVRRIDAEMTLHDAAIYSIRPWWKRQIRSGYGGMEVALRLQQRGQEGFLREQVRSAWWWGLVWPMALVGGVIVGGMIGGVEEVILVAVVWGAVTVGQIGRIARRGVGRGLTWVEGVKYGGLTLLSKWPQMIGQVRWWRDRRKGKRAEIIEYKG
ncbi:MAG: glycosyltransferase [Phycisphaeraceae bacterium]|nr:glycosyltransferase [Phycisphaeraceae bacterium]